MRRQAGFFDVDDRLKRLSDLGDQLEAFEAAGKLKPHETYSAINRHSPDGRRFKVYSETASGFWQA